MMAELKDPDDEGKDTENDINHTEFLWKKPVELFEEKFVKVCAPMVRYSK